MFFAVAASPYLDDVVVAAAVATAAVIVVTAAVIVAAAVVAAAVATTTTVVTTFVASIVSILYPHMGAAEISAGGENFFSQGGGLQKKTQGGGLFLKFKVWVGRGKRKFLCLQLTVRRKIPFKTRKKRKIS